MHDIPDEDVVRAHVARAGLCDIVVLPDVHEMSAAIAGDLLVESDAACQDVNAVCVVRVCVIIEAGTNKLRYCMAPSCSRCHAVVNVYCTKVVVVLTYLASQSARVVGAKESGVRVKDTAAVEITCAGRVRRVAGAVQVLPARRTGCRASDTHR